MNSLFNKGDRMFWPIALIKFHIKSPFAECVAIWIKLPINFHAVQLAKCWWSRVSCFYIALCVSMCLCNFHGKAWAEASQRSHSGTIPKDPSMWKRNFQSALRVGGFIMLADYKNDAGNSHMVYRWPEERPQSGGKPIKNERREILSVSWVNSFK